MDIYIGLIGYARDFSNLTRKMSEEQRKKYVHIYDRDSWRGRRFEKLIIISEYITKFRDLEKDARYNLVSKNANI